MSIRAFLLKGSCSSRRLARALCTTHAAVGSEPAMLSFVSSFESRSSASPPGSSLQSTAEAGSGDRQRRPSGSSGGISDQEWDIRTGRAIYILQQTLPDFFQIGLVGGLDRGALGAADDADSEGVAHQAPVASTSDDTQNGQHKLAALYAPTVKLAYTTPVNLPGVGSPVLRIEGLPLYASSAVFVRTTMKVGARHLAFFHLRPNLVAYCNHNIQALHTELSVSLKRIRVHAGPGSFTASGVAPWMPSMDVGQRFSEREKAVFISLDVTGKARVSGASNVWEVNSTYAFSPSSGLIASHVINSIYPAPHRSVYEALRGFGLAFGGGRGEPGTACEGTSKQH